MMMMIVVHSVSLFGRRFLPLDGASWFSRRRCRFVVVIDGRCRQKMHSWPSHNLLRNAQLRIFLLRRKTEAKWHRNI